MKRAIYRRQRSLEEQDRQACYDSTHRQTMKFEIARAVVQTLTRTSRSGKSKRALRSRHQLVSQG